MTFFQKVKLFLAPLKEQKLLAILSSIKFSGYAIYAIASVLIIKWWMNAITLWNKELYTQYIWWFVVFFWWYLILAWIFRTTDWPHMYHNTEKWIYKRYLDQIIHLDNNYIEKIGTGKMISIFRDGKKVWMDQLSFLIKECSKIWVTWIFLFYMLLQIDWKYACILVFWLAIMHILVVWIDTIAHKHRRVRTQEQHEVSRKLVRIIMSKNEILQNNTLKNEISSVIESVDYVSDANNKINRSLFFIFNLVRIFAVAMRILILVVVWYGVFEKSFTIIDFATTMAMIIVFESFLFDSTEFYKNFTKDFSDIEKLWETLDDAPKMQWYHSWNPFSPSLKNIEISNITYGYSDAKVFKDFSITIPHGKKTALVWASGGGKTTLIKLIAGYLHPESGNISVMGNILGKTALKTYYPHIGYLTQDPSVFDATIRENLLSAINHKSENTTWESTEEILISALKLAQCDFVFELEKWLDTEIWERWVRLSGGQKQRLAIAKIFLKNPEIILLDEPTSALDSFSEEKITEALNTLFEWRTVIIVAHRLQTVKKADDIIVIEWWTVVERGNHDSLVKAWWIYNKMLELQSGF